MSNQATGSMETDKRRWGGAPLEDLTVSVRTISHARNPLWAPGTCMRADTRMQWLHLPEQILKHYSHQRALFISAAIFNSALSPRPSTHTQLPSPDGSAAKIHPLTHLLLSRFPAATYSQLLSSLPWTTATNLEAGIPTTTLLPDIYSLLHSWPETPSEASHCIQDKIFTET